MLGTVTDESLVARALAGSNSAWTKLVKRYEKRVYNYALRMVGHPDDAFDLMQEVFMGVHRNLAGFRGDAPFPGWLFRIASFRCTDYLPRIDTTHFYTYLMEHINDCDKGKLRTDRLAELAYRYSN